ncbi:hypothetical protein [Gracilibacillus salinarum]|uniref:Uncharacterized protein n=1 Tax=Gracilibacillus salinarum TaxID=2932255 RepID=A0ABY4GQF9_9BACI|nr:hypothetical protein [Gracilibacillus salinarum]UOQ86474.1 hypothetical protein MUN87_06195 [Gracilibacillus salinarum]
MWNVISERIPTLFTIVCTLLAYAVPYLVYKINQQIHKALDPPWKKEENNKPDQ